MSDEYVPMAPAWEKLIDSYETEAGKYRTALELIAHHEPQQDERAEAMRQIARRTLGMRT